ncbi:hypothetical protein BV898_12498 [Hypsibius exemplaris]|uniref:Potassium channel domain-containing protein n=1 Tax=Hypsibius exemplaris TaxID=2072580 RepID=A0A1W0WDQ1_HYPEX|nr:hypothetical protein BV898_12498 [Hypsibius exemplaris]
MPNTFIQSTAGVKLCLTRCNRKQCCRTTVAFLFSHIGLTALVVGYSVMGAFLFQHLEQEHELQKVSVIQEWKEDTVEDIWSLTTNMHLEKSLQDHCTTSCEPLNRPPLAQALLQRKRAEHATEQIEVVKREMIDTLWNLTLDLNVLWKDNWTELADHHVTDFFRRAQTLLEDTLVPSPVPTAAPQIQCSTTCAVSMNSSAETKKNWTDTVTDTIDLFQRNITEATRDGFESQKMHTKWTFSSSFLYALSVITTIGYGHVTPKTTQGKIVTVIYAVVGIPIMLLFLANVGDFLARIFRAIFSYISSCSFGRTSKSTGTSGSLSRRGKGGRKRSQSRSLPGGSRQKRTKLRNLGKSVSVESPSLAPIAPTWDTTDDDEGDSIQVVSTPSVPRRGNNPESGRKRKGSNSVPVLGCLVIMGSYLFGGAMLFALWEDWPYLDAFYFCFVTLTTIGFGDFVPGASMLGQDTASQKLVVCCVYVLVGLALIACCFNLMQEQVRWYATEVARILGLVDDSKEDVVIETERVNLEV